MLKTGLGKWIGILLLASTTTAPETELRSRLSVPSLEIVLSVNSFTADPTRKKSSKTIFLGNLGPVASKKILSVTCETNTPRMYSAAFREKTKETAKPDRSSDFELGKIACSRFEFGDPASPFFSMEYRAFPCAEGYRFEIRILHVGEGSDHLSQEECNRIFESFHIVGKRGYPQQVVDFLAGARKENDPLAWSTNQAATRSQDFIPLICVAELLQEKGDSSLAEKYFADAAHLLEAKKSLATGERFLLGVAWDGLAWSLVQQEKGADAANYYEKALKAWEETRDLDRRDEALYQIASAWAQAGDAAKSASWIKRYMVIAPNCKSRIHEDSAFSKVRESAEFRGL